MEERERPTEERKKASEKPRGFIQKSMQNPLLIADQFCSCWVNQSWNCSVSAKDYFIKSLKRSKNCSADEKFPTQLTDRLLYRITGHVRLRAVSCYRMLERVVASRLDLMSICVEMFLLWMDSFNLVCCYCCSWWTKQVLGYFLMNSTSQP